MKKEKIKICINIDKDIKDSCDIYIDNLSRMADMADNIDTNKLFFINYKNAKNQYGKSQYYDIFYGVPDCYMLYKIKDELYLSQFGEIAIFRISVTLMRGEKWYVRHLKTDKAEFLYMRPTLTFKDISTLEHKYDFIACRSQKIILQKDQ